MKLKIGQIEIFSSHLIWVVDSCISIVSTLFIYLLFCYTLGIDIDTTLMRNMTILTIVASFLYTRLCKTHLGIIRHTTVAELTRLVYAMFLKSITLLILAYITLDYVGRFIYTLIFADFICSLFLQMFMRTLIVNFYIHIVHFTSKTKEKVFIYGTSQAAVSLAKYLRGNNFQYEVKGFLTRNRGESSLRIMSYPIFYLDGKKELTQKEVALILGISQSYISRIEKKVIRKLKSVVKV